jgi:heme/copper-type cytochrome/quinol oxidase subunit 2
MRDHVSFLESLHDLVIVWLLLILVVVLLVRARVVSRPRGKLNQDSSLLEQGWTIIPILVLVRIAYPRIHLLYLQDFFTTTPLLTMKVVGNQWNWQTSSELEVDHLLDIDQLENNASYETPILVRKGLTQLVIRRSDVLHSLGLPNLGIKLDATPGRLNATIIESNIEGVSVGSCYELCGRGHSAIPVQVVFRKAR